MMFRPNHFIFRKKRQVSAAICVMLAGSLAVGCAYMDHKKSVSLGSGNGDPAVTAAFDDFLNELFQSEVTSNSINLHYTLSDPKAFGIEDYDVTLGDLSSDSLAENYATIENTLAQLKTYDYTSLSGNQQLTYDILSDYLQKELSVSNLDYYDEILKPSTGTQAQLPILYEEYEFRTVTDIEDYLDLIAQTDSYFDKIIAYEKEKADAGLFMSDYACSTIISQCNAFTENVDNNYLIVTFDNKIDAFEGLTESERDTYKAENEQNVKEHVIPAYENLSAALEELKGSGTNDNGLCYFADGKDYYEYLVYTATGSSLSIPDMENAISKQRSADLSAANTMMSDDPELWERCNEVTLTITEPESILKELQEQMLADFPAAPDTNFSIHYVDECMEDYLAPAFYITSPVDDYTNNSIYINPASEYADMKLFTTLAHEGYPGHLYQTVMTHTFGIEPIRSMLNYPGYVEGWATYVEMKSYHYAGLDENVATLLERNQSALLSLYATTDLGIHYDGWTLDDTTSFWNQYGITSASTIQDIYELIVEEPAHYLEYYVGYLNFLQLKDNMQKTYFTNFDEKAFHQALLEIGPAPFDIIEKYLPAYYENALK